MFLCLNLSFAFVELFYGIWVIRGDLLIQANISPYLILALLSPSTVDHHLVM